MKVLSLFDGMACGMLAAMGADIEVEKYVAYEIDKYAIQTSKHNFPMIEHRGDVFEADFTEFKDFDILCGGSPCTYWSIAQKNNRETEASGMGWELFSQYVRALHEAKPKYFVYENNKSMSKAIRASITETFGFEPICINSALVSAQNRQRLYWVGKREADGTYSKVDVEQPKDRGILLRDILESGTAWQDKSFAYTTRCQGAIPSDTLEKHRHTMVAEPVRVGTYPNASKNPKHDSQQYRIYSVDGKAVTQCGNGGGLGAKTGLYAIHICVTTEEKSHTIKAQYYKNGTANFVTNGGFSASAVAESIICAEPCEWDENGRPTKAISSADGKTYTVYEVKNGIITIKGKEYPIKLSDGFYIIRKLTVRECMRLQTVPEWYEFPVSDTQAYKMLGNGWTVEVIAHIFNSLPIVRRAYDGHNI